MSVRFIVTGSDNLNQWWMTETLIHSFKKHGNNFPLTIIWASDGKPKYIPSYGELFITPNYYQILYDNQRINYIPINRITGITEYLKQYSGSDEYFVYLDPDMVFTKNFNPLLYGLSECKVICGEDQWRNHRNLRGVAMGDFNHVFETFSILNPYKHYFPPSIVPVCMHINDLKCLCNRWEDLTLAIHKYYQYKNGYVAWTCEIFAFDIICAEYNIEVEASMDMYHFGNDIRSVYAPMIHYLAHGCSNEDDTWRFNKREWIDTVPKNITVPNNLLPASKEILLNIHERFQSINNPQMLIS